VLAIHKATLGTNTSCRIRVREARAARSPFIEHADWMLDINLTNPEVHDALIFV
jgi:hypothetical protein